jgi:hypothetical protein
MRRHATGNYHAARGPPTRTAHNHQRSRIREISHPQPVRRTRGELTFHQVRSTGSVRVGHRGAGLLTAHRTDQTQGAHQPFHPAPAHRNPLPVQRPPHLLYPIHRIVLLIHPGNVFLELFITHRPRRQRSDDGGVIRGRSDPHTEISQHGADRLDSEPFLMLCDKRYERGSRGSSSLAKKTDAAFRISFARRNSRFSRRNSRSASASPDVIPAR